MCTLQLEEKKKKAKSEGRSSIEEDDPDKVGATVSATCTCVQFLAVFIALVIIGLSSLPCGFAVSTAVAQSNHKDVCRH